MDAPLRPQYFVSRQDGSLTPLIAVDELPQLVSIRGVPRLLTQNDTHGMTSLGSANHRGQYYVIDYLPQGTVSVIEQKAFPAVPKNGNRNGKETKPNQRSQKGHSKKEYCSFWLRHGCIFKHEMPRDLSTLEKLGLRDIPRWYREKHNVKSVAASIENVKSLANRSNAQALMNAKHNHSMGLMMSGASLDGCDMPMHITPAFTSGDQGHANGVNHPQGHNGYAMVSQPNFPGQPIGRNKTQIPSALVDGFGPYKRVGPTNADNSAAHKNLDTISNALKDKDNFVELKNAYETRHLVHSVGQPAAAGVAEVQKAQPFMGNYMRKDGLLDASADNVIVSRPDGKATPTLKLATRSPWILHKDKTNFSELSMSPYAPPNPVSEFLEDEEQSNRKHNNSRRLYQPRIGKPFMGQGKANATNNAGFDILQDQMKAFYPFGGISPNSRDGLRTPNGEMNTQSSSSPSSTGRNSSAHSSRSSLENGNDNKGTTGSLFVERTASMTSRIFDINGCARDKGFQHDLLSDLGLNSGN